MSGGGPLPSAVVGPGEVPPARIHDLAHPPDRLNPADEHGLADEEVADVELDDLGDGRDRAPRPRRHAG
jgi:hypothetical protein